MHYYILIVLQFTLFQSSPNIIKDNSPVTTIKASAGEVCQEISIAGTSNCTATYPCNEQCTLVPATNNQTIDTCNHPQYEYLKWKTPSEFIQSKNQLDYALVHLETILNQRKETLDEVDHFSLMIASKIKKIENTVDREVLMNSIQNLIFEYYMKDKQIITPAQPQSSVSDIQSSTIDQNQYSNAVNMPMESYCSPGCTICENTPQCAASINYVQQSDTITTTPTMNSTSQVSNETSPSIASISESGSTQILPDGNCPLDTISTLPIGSTSQVSNQASQGSLSKSKSTFIHIKPTDLIRPLKKT